MPGAAPSMPGAARPACPERRVLHARSGACCPAQRGCVLSA